MMPCETCKQKEGKGEMIPEGAETNDRAPFSMALESLRLKKEKVSNKSENY